jgi:alkylhydroperoxidase/carboxymuconolactone decarboxylase family protein YurZ
MSAEPTEEAELQSRLSLAQEAMKDLFGVEFPIDPEPGEPPNARDLNSRLVEHAFLDSWARPGLDRRTKSVATIAMMVATGQSRELRAHVSGALLLGISRDEIVELLIHTLAYCGAPRTNSAWIEVRKVFAKQRDGSLEQVED